MVIFAKNHRNVSQKYRQCFTKILEKCFTKYPENLPRFFRFEFLKNRFRKNQNLKTTHTPFVFHTYPLCFLASGFHTTQARPYFRVQNRIASFFKTRQDYQLVFSLKIQKKENCTHNVTQYH
jgi:hypothetical protein